jgi:serine protease
MDGETLMPFRALKYLGLFLVLGLLVACPPSGGVVSGTISLGVSLSAAPVTPVSSGDVLAGRLLVQFKPSSQALKGRSMQVAGLRLQRWHELGTTGLEVLQAPNLNQTQTLELAQTLAARADVIFAEPDRIIKAFTAPNDPSFPAQWNLQPRAAAQLGSVNPPADWATLPDTSSLIVAVLDSGILFDPTQPSASHPDFGQILPGYDFISDAAVAEDGDARDANAFDSGSSAEFHGSFVAGLVAATQNNALGIAGLSNARILPVRAIGSSGGALSDLLDAMLWAVGEPVAGVPSNPNPADVLNLSLGSSSACSQAEQVVINRILALPNRPVIVAAAGNDNTNVTNASPASCAGIISVGAVNRNAERANYSNFGSSITIMAAGGERNSSNQFEAGLAITSLGKSSAVFGTRLNVGTSFAAPQVAALVAMMKVSRANKTEIDSLRAKDILRRTAVPISALSCNRPNSFECGAGLVDVVAALSMAQGVLPDLPDFTIQLEPSSLSLTRGESRTIKISINRLTGFSQRLGFVLEQIGTGFTGSFTALSTIGNESGFVLRVASDAPIGNSILSIRATGEDGTSRVSSTSVQISAVPVVSVDQTILVVVPMGLGQPPSLVQRLELSESDINWRTGFSVKLAAGRYYLLAVKDFDGSKSLSSGDYFGAYSLDGSSLTAVIPPLDNVDFDLEIVSDPTKVLEGLGSSYLILGLRDLVEQVLQ